MDVKKTVWIIMLQIMMCYCNAQTSSATDATPSSGTTKSSDFPGWATPVVCIVVIFLLIILYIIWRYRDSWCCSCYIEGCCQGGVEDNIIIPLPVEGPGRVRTGSGCVDRYSASAYTLRELSERHGEVHKVEENNTSKYNDPPKSFFGDLTNHGYIDTIEEDSVLSSDWTDSEFESLIVQAEEWKQRCIQEGNYDDVCFTGNRFIASLFDCNGGMLRMDNMGIRLLIPPGAIEGKVQLIYMYVVTNTENMPLIEDGQARVAPTVFCGPQGTEFFERVVLSYEHCANISDGASNLRPVFTTSRPNENVQFKSLEEEDDVLVLKRPGRCLIMISHFTGFSCIGTSMSPDRPLEIFMNLVVYSSSINSQMILRLYYVHKTTDAMQMVSCEEESVGGIKRTPMTTWLFKTNFDAISLLEIEHNWESKNLTQIATAKMLRENNYVTRSYLLSKTSSSGSNNITNGNSVAGTIQVSQPVESDESTATLHILAEVNNGTTEIPKTRTSVLLKQPLRQTLKKMLDPDCAHADWRMLAHELKLDDMIPKLETDAHTDAHRSPTYALLNMWEFSRPGDDSKDWLILEGIFEKIGRKDVVTEIIKAKSESGYIKLSCTNQECDKK